MNTRARNIGGGLAVVRPCEARRLFRRLACQQLADGALCRAKGWRARAILIKPSGG